MRFTYTYRSSDGIRHVAEIDAPGRDEAFAILRRRGIRPIKVMEAEKADDAGRRGIKPLCRCAVPAVLLAACALLAIGAWWRLGPAARRPPDDRGARYQSGTREAILKLIERAGALEDRCRAELTLLKLDRLHDYAWIEKEKDLSPLYREMEKAQAIIDYTRTQAKDLFRDVYRQFPATCANERTDAQRRYGELMNALDAEEERRQAAHLALMLLDDHRPAWRTAQGQIVFSDPKIEEEFRFCTMPTDGSTARWKRDFGKGGEPEP